MKFTVVLHIGQPDKIIVVKPDKIIVAEHPDYVSGNWAEGLTTFMADYAFAERAGAESAREMRLSWLRDFAAIPPGQDRPLNQFTSRTHGTSQIVGYHKAAMLFFMLRDRLGRERFDAGLRLFWEREQFKTASWDDLRRAFEAAGGESLESFFKPWLSRPGAPEIGMVNAECSASGKGYRLQLLLTQSAVPYQLRVPLTVRTAADDEAAVIELAGERANFELTTQARPEAVILDPEFRLFRRLGRHEAQPILRDAMVNPKTATVIAGGDAAFAASAASLAQQLMDYPAKPVNLPRGDIPYASS